MAEFVIRTVRNGRVKINGNIYRPDETHMKHDGRLNGKRFAFGLYAGKPDLISLWGTEEEYGKPVSVDHNGPQVVNGSVPWLFWYAKAEPAP
jgi:hypothetical protein